MRRVVILLILTALAGCKGVSGPLASSRPRDRADDPLFTIEEQKRRAAERYAIPEDDRNISPPAFMSRPGPTGITSTR